ncbi:type I-C CRISPR-associated protein Cas8c/Csd1 [Micromonospora sp. WMMD1102]|uniref:type I-C CRISPR-associated protein Cas8c/Csd1 n=1 Tax=Micromonospora sp. WMMD1102 TaxID=3016105 RepID=UPI002414F7C6|nr:type I-C CRISPR-associated protein Cas8c/Csd1 [Micromonospora sp. WMMD1102]MDG4788678.1 type I-C CRISPR-associated protein Cas8c/Csd1 [Micromonospora sp. WMMD1102]
MLLRRLVEYADTTDEVIPPFYGRKPIRFLLPIAADGTPLHRRMVDTVNPDAGDRFGRERLVPAVTRTVGIAPALAADNVEYVLGWVTDEGGNAGRVAKQHAAFQELIRDWAAAEPDGPAPAVAAFYANGHDRTIVLPEKWSRADQVAFQVDGEVACEHESARRYWATVAAGRKGLGRAGRCLVCGEVRDLLKTIPQQIPRRLLPGATQSASLVSVNEAVHGYELTKFLAHTPICVTCGLTFMSSLTVLLGSERHSSVLPGQNSRLIWWLVGGSRFDPMKLLDEPDDADIGLMLAAPAQGAEPTVDDLSTFCSVAVSGNVARAVIRDWVEQPLPAIKRNLSRWFDDLLIVDWSGQLTRVRLSQLVRAAGRWQRGRGGANGTWIKLGAKGEDRPGDLHPGLLRAALLHRPLPPRLLGHVINRIQADARVDPARAALIRLALRRRRPNLPADELERLTPTVNPENDDPAYLSGRAFAVLDDLQQAVYRAANQPLNTTFAERYMGRAITNPRAVLVNGQRTATAWLRRLRGPLRRPSWATAYANRLDDIFARIDDKKSIPNSGVLAQKALFVLGYHQQRAAMRAERIEAAANKKKSDLPPTDDEQAPEGDAE